jgi:hypothetical protein
VNGRKQKGRPADWAANKTGKSKYYLADFFVQRVPPQKRIVFHEFQSVGMSAAVFGRRVP